MAETIQVEQVPIERIKENPLNRSIFNGLDDEKRAALKEYISKRGLLKPLVVNQDNVLLAGHERLSICRELGHRTVPVQRMAFSDQNGEAEFLIKDNLLSRNLSPVEIGKAGIYLEQVVKKWNRKGKPLKDIVSRTLGISSFQYVKMKYILAFGDETFIARVDRRELSVGKAYSVLKARRVKSEQRQKALTEKVRFRLIHEDPMAALGNFRPESCDVVIAEPPENYNPVWVDLAHRALKETGSLFILTQKNLTTLTDALSADFMLVAPVVVLSKTHVDSRFIWNHRHLVWFAKTMKFRMLDRQVSTVWDFRMSGEDTTVDTIARILSLTTSPGDIVIRLFGDNRPCMGIEERFQRHFFAIQPDRDAYVREKLRV